MLSKSDRQRIVVQLREFSCSDREADLYVECLQFGPSSVMDLSRCLDMNRVTVHSAVKQLIKKGLMVETRKGKKRLIVAEDPEVLFRLVQKEKNALQVKEMNLDHVVRLLNSVLVSGGGRPSVRFYEGVDGFKKMLEESLTAKGEILVFTYVDLFQAILDPDYLENYFKRRAAKGIHTRLIFPPCSFAERVNKNAKKYKIQVRLLPSSLTWTSGFFSWNDCVALMSYTEGRLTCTIMENKDITDFVRRILFEYVWRQAEPMA